MRLLVKGLNAQRILGDLAFSHVHRTTQRLDLAGTQSEERPL